MDLIAPEAKTPLTASDFPTPGSSARSQSLRGIDLVLADGKTWTLADYVPAFGPVWDRLYDGNLLAGRYDLGDVFLGASRLLLANYDLPADFAAWLIAETKPTFLVTAIEGALFGHRDVIHSWTDWAESALLANGIDPATVPPHRLRLVLDQLVGLGRARPHAEFTTAGIAASQRRSLMAKFDRQGIKPS